ncbi:hypothetical protein B0H13DRAFT_1882985 [Mycena leptocephala]|nr:hypothetical protein B0H13DRAFT_1882985 [Mycena leptocephala]
MVRSLHSLSNLPLAPYSLAHSGNLPGLFSAPSVLARGPTCYPLPGDHLPSPYPSANLILPQNYRGHDVSYPQINTIQQPGGYRQVCMGCPKCPAKKKIFFIVPGLPLDVLQSGILGRLARARAELMPIPRLQISTASISVSPASSPSPSAPTAVSPSHTASPLPASSPLAPSSRATTPEAETPARATPVHDPLRFDFGGYGGLHYSPEGNILFSAATTAADIDMSSDDGLELQYPSEAQPQPPSAQDNRILDLTNPVHIFSWDIDGFPPIQIVAYPRIPQDDEAHRFRVGEVVLEEYRAVLEAAGFAVQSHIQRYLAPSNIWVTVPWSTYTVSVYGPNTIVYLRNPGMDVTVPDHVLELFPHLNSDA